MSLDTVTYVRNLEDCGFKAKDLYDTAREVGAPDIEMAIASIVGNLFGTVEKLRRLEVGVKDSP